jgi:hypothetical protein
LAALDSSFRAASPAHAGGAARRVRAAGRAVAVFAVLASLVVLPGRADAAVVTDCRADPGPIAGTITNDAAIEVHDLHRSEAQNCAAITERLDELLTAINSADDPTTPATRVSLVQADRDRLSLAALGPWALVGLTICLLFAQPWFAAWRFLR